MVGLIMNSFCALTIFILIVPPCLFHRLFLLHLVSRTYDVAPTVLVEPFFCYSTNHFILHIFFFSCPPPPLIRWSLLPLGSELKTNR